MHQIILSEQTLDTIAETNKLIAKIAFSGLFSYSIHRFGYVWFDLIQKQKQEKLEIDNSVKMNILKTMLEQEINQKKELATEILELKNKLNEYAEENEFIKNRLTRKKKEKLLEEVEYIQIFARKKLLHN